MKILNKDVDEKFYYGEIPRKDMRGILRSYKHERNIEKVIHAYCDKTNNEYFRSYALDPRRGICLKLFPNIKKLRILDYGCGLGSIGIIASKLGAAVTYVDSCLERLKVAQMRCRDAGVTNATFIACRSWRSMPRHRFFDLIILNGIVEWIPQTEGRTHATAKEEQLAFLKSMKGSLRKKGKIFLAMENRFAFRYFFGYPEDHTGIAFLSLLSRRIANFIHVILKKTDFTTLTWSRQEYAEIARLLGFTSVEGYALFPDYRFPEKIIPLTDTRIIFEEMKSEEKSIMKLFKKYLLEILYGRHILANYVYSYGYVFQIS